MTSSTVVDASPNGTAPAPANAAGGGGGGGGGRIGSGLLTEAGALASSSRASLAASPVGCPRGRTMVSCITQFVPSGLWWIVKGWVVSVRTAVTVLVAP